MSANMDECVSRVHHREYGELYAKMHEKKKKKAL